MLTGAAIIRVSRRSDLAQPCWFALSEHPADLVVYAPSGEWYGCVDHWREVMRPFFVGLGHKITYDEEAESLLAEAESC